MTGRANGAAFCPKHAYLYNGVLFFFFNILLYFIANSHIRGQASFFVFSRENAGYLFTYHPGVGPWQASWLVIHTYSLVQSRGISSFYRVILKLPLGCGTG